MIPAALSKALGWIAPTMVIAIAGAIHFFPEIPASLLAYERELVFRGEYWRIATGHLTHTNLNHLLLNCAGLLLAWALLPLRPRPHQALAGLVILGVLCGLALLLFEPGIHWYRGLSGVIHASLAFGAVLNCTVAGERWWGVVVLSSLAVKVYTESYGTDGSLVSQWIAAPVVTEAHFWGVATGIAVAGLFLIGIWLGQQLGGLFGFQLGQRSRG